MSGAAVARDHDAALSEGRHLVGRTPCGAARDGAEVLACLRALPAAELVAATHLPPTFADLGLARAPTYGPTVDGVFLPEAPLALIARRHGSKNVAPPAVLVGSNAEELVGLLPATGLTAERWPEALRAFVAEPLAAATGGDVDAILAELLATYPLTLAASPDAVLAELLGDLRFTCPARRLLAATAGPEARAYRYLFARRVATVYGPLPASHGREVPLFFGSWRNLPGYAPAEEDALLSEAMAEALATFARDGLPAVTGPAWRPYGEEGDTLRWDAPVTVVHDPGAARCGLWERLRGDDDEG
jgi:carboxylesterase type B